MTTRRTLLAALCTAAVLIAPAAQARDTLTLRVNDAIAPPGGLAAVVVRTYATKPISQGQICFRARSRSRAGVRALAASNSHDVFAAIEGVKVFAKRKDGVSIGTLERSNGDQLVLIQFTSDSGSINSSDGPLAVVFVRLSDELTPGQEYELEIDAANTAVTDAQGNPVRFAPRAGRLRIRHPADPYEAEAEGDKIRPGQVAEVGMETFEPVGITSAQIGFTYDPAIAAGRPRVKLSNRYGRRRFSVDRTTPGLVLVTLTSRKGRWNTVPGEVVAIRLRTSSTIPAGTRSAVALNPGLTYFLDEDGDVLPFELETGHIRFENDRGDDDDDDDDD